MKLRSVCLLAVSAIVWMSLVVSCTPYREAGRSGKVPPGQAKKIYGQKSARDFAPGHNK
ncbi:hypothetical protein [Arachidicoccus terrestris]|uniref:hypothetical protein n=1 Tax=Arachidicoccus terrestris TaxID=2875539 RepID=UPI001CC435DB|nr:hypothetical protein [Arachidicoccus terrestris]UAY56926.1 hypothetical protein K9M52_08045 [Arachidicoccus terrestris]